MCIQGQILFKFEFMITYIQIQALPIFIFAIISIQFVVISFIFSNHLPFKHSPVTQAVSKGARSLPTELSEAGSGLPARPQMLSTVVIACRSRALPVINCTKSPSSLHCKI